MHLTLPNFNWCIRFRLSKRVPECACKFIPFIDLDCDTENCLLFFSGCIYFPSQTGARVTSENLRISRDTRAGSCQRLLTAASTGVAPERSWKWRRELKTRTKTKCSDLPRQQVIRSRAKRGFNTEWTTNGESGPLAMSLVPLLFIGAGCSTCILLTLSSAPVVWNYSLGENHREPKRILDRPPWSSFDWSLLLFLWILLDCSFKPSPRLL